MTLRHMKIFVAVCEENSVTRAAEKLHLAQPAVSTAIKELEEYYQVKLFDRISRRLYLTDAGQSLLNYAAHIVSLFDSMEDSIRQWGSSGTLKIGASITIGTHLMPRYAAAFAKSHPQARVEVFIGSSDLIEKKILQNELDFALIEGTVHSSSIFSESYMRDRLAIICSPGDPLAKQQDITVEQLLSRPLLLREKGSGTRELFDQALSFLEYSCTPAWESTSTEALIRAVREGLGISALPFLLVWEELQAGSVAELTVENLRLERGFHIIYHKNKYHTRLAREFMEMCRQTPPESKGDANPPD